MDRRTLLVLAAAAFSMGRTLAQSSSSSASAGSGTASKTDRTLITDLAQANMAEVQAGKLALDKSVNDQVKHFAQKMVDDHGAALSQVQRLAQKKGVKLPDGVGLENEAIDIELKALTGDTFNSQYMKRAGVDAHERTLKLLQKIQQEAQDTDLKALAAQMKPTVQQHLDMAQKTTASLSTAKK